MFTSSFLRRIAAVVLMMHALLVVQVPQAQAAMIGTPEIRKRPPCTHCLP
tara:strand:- start:1627 stop:1776 length:150 start_codon:yes stop_codon:yes gene_type:complete